MCAEVYPDQKRSGCELQMYKEMVFDEREGRGLSTVGSLVV